MLQTRLLALLGKSSTIQAAGAASRELRGFASGAAFSRKDVVNNLDNREDPEVDSAIRAYMKAQFASPKVEKAEEVYELASQVEKKYVAAQAVESGIQNIALPLSGEGASVKRFAAQLLQLGSKAGFESPAVEVAKRVAEKAKTADTVKELLTSSKSLMSPDFHAALLEALQQVETEINGSVTLDGGSAGYKKFAEKVKAVASQHGIDWKLLVDAKSQASDEVRQAYAAYLQKAVVADAEAEAAAVRADATVLLDKHLAKSAEQVRKEQEAAAAALLRRLESAKGAKWAQAYQEDLKAVAEYDKWRATA